MQCNNIEVGIHKKKSTGLVGLCFMGIKSKYKAVLQVDKDCAFTGLVCKKLTSHVIVTYGEGGKRPSAQWT